MKSLCSVAVACSLLLLALCTGSGAATVRPVPSKGARSKTIVVYTQTHAPYSLLNALELLKLQLGRFESVIETVPVYQANPSNIVQCDYLVVLSLDAHESIPTNLVAAIASAAVPVLWVGLGIDAIERIPSLRGQIEPGPIPEPQSARSLIYHKKTWDVGAFSYRNVRVSAKTSAQVLLGAAHQEDQGQNAPFCWRFKDFILFAADPQNAGLGNVFEDILFDFFGVETVPQSSVLLRIDGYRPGRNHRDFKRMADYLQARSIPFVVSISGLNEATKTSDQGVEFISALRYGQQRGGRISLQGSETPSEGAEFWDERSDRPRMQITGGGIRNRVSGAAESVLRAELLPLAWETPKYAASFYSYQEIAAVFGTAIERIQLSDATSRDNYAAAGLTMDQHGRLILPENLGFMSSSSNSLAGLQARADLLASLRGSILGASFDSYLPFAELVKLVALLESYHLPFLDLADFDNRVQMPSAVLLTGNATASASLQNAGIRWKTFNRAGQLLAEDEQRTRVSGKREFKRIGIGVFEVIEYSNQIRQ